MMRILTLSMEYPTHSGEEQVTLAEHVYLSDCVCVCVFVCVCVCLLMCV